MSSTLTGEKTVSLARFHGRGSRHVARLLVCCVVGGLLGASIQIARANTDARSESILSAEIGPQPLAEALTAFATQTGLQIFYVSHLVKARRSKGARPGLSPSDALTQLLDGTGLTFEFLNARTVKIFAVPVAAAPAAAPVATRSNWHTALSTRTTERIVVTASRSGSHDHGSLVPVEDVRIVPLRCMPEISWTRARRCTET